jgi:FkbM family methyltransferase
MNNASSQITSPEAEQLQVAAQEIARLRADLNAILAPHLQFGQVEKGASGLAHGARNLLKKATRRSLRWYTGNQHQLQGAVYRLLHDLAGVLEAHEAALRDLGVGVQDLRVRLRALEYNMHHMRMSGRVYEAVKAADAGDPILAQPAWDVNLPKTVTASDLFYCFRLLLNRIPDQQEWVAHYSRIGEDLDKVVASILNSHEFMQRHLLDRSAEAATLVEMPAFKMYVSPDDNYIGGSIIREHEYEPFLTRLFGELLRPGMQVLDVGANMGYFSLLAASLVGESGRVYSWEPSPSNVKMLLASHLANGFKNIEIVQAAAGRRSGLLNYFPNFSNGMVNEIGQVPPEQAFAAETVMALRIDDVLPRDAKIDFVKIDVEGFEYEALNGALETLRRCRPTIVSEFCPKSLLSSSGISGEEFLRFVVQLGYDMQVVDDKKLIPGDIPEVLAMHKKSGIDHIDILFRPR